MNHKILIVDDHHETLDIIVMTVQSYGYEAVFTHSPVKALKMATVERPDLALVDMNMPEMSGLEVVRRLRSNPVVSEIPIIMFTAEDHPDQKKAGFAAGVDDYLIKPVPPDEMVARIEEMLEGLEPHAASQNKRTVIMQSSSSDEERKADQGIIGVLGASGGVGTTVTALNLATIFASSGRPATLVDMDMKQGHIALYLNKRPTKSLNNLAENKNLQARDVIAQVMTPSKKLRLLMAHSNVDSSLPMLDGEQTAVMLNTLRSDQYLICDIGIGISPATLPVVKQADHLILCLRAERISLTVTRHLIKSLKENMRSTSRLHLFLLDKTGGIPKDAAERFIKQSITAVIPHEKRMTNAVNKGIPFATMYPKYPASLMFRQFAKQLVKSLARK